MKTAAPLAGSLLPNKRIVAFYKDRGYPDAKVTSFDVKLNDKQDAVAVTVNIDEGQPVLVFRQRR